MTERSGEGITVAMVNNKGGVGETTSAVNLAPGITAGKRYVLLVDLDAQGSASLDVTSLGSTYVTTSHPGRFKKKPL